MEWTEKIISPIEKQLIVTNSSDEIANAYEQSYKEVQKTFTLSGFRKGKVPLDQVKKHVGEDIQQNVADHLIHENLKKILPKLNPAPIDRPICKVTVFDRKSVATFTVSYEHWPNIDTEALNNLSSITIEEQKLIVDEKSIDEQIANIRKKKAILKNRFEEKDEAKYIQMGDYLQISLELRDKISEKMLYRQEKFFLELGKTNVLPGFDECIVGLETNQEKYIDLSIPDDFSDERYAGKDIRVYCKILRAEYPTLSLLDAKFFSDLSKEMNDDKITDIQKWRNRIKADFENLGEKRLQQNSVQKAILKLVDTIEFDVPKAMLRWKTVHNLQHIYNKLGLKETVKQENVPACIERLAQLLKRTPKDIKQDLKIGVEKTVRQEIIVHELEKKFPTNISDEEIDIVINKEYNSLQSDNALPQQEKLRESVKWRIHMDKLNSILYEKLKITKKDEITIHELAKS